MRPMLIALIAAVALTGCDRGGPSEQAGDKAPVAPAPATSARAITASFDCGRARGQAQELVCGDSSLAAMDREVARLAGLSAEPAGQADYALERDNCWKADELRQCVMAAAMTEIHRLRQGLDMDRDGAGPSAGPLDYNCRGITGLVRATFVNAQPGAVALEWGGQVIAIDEVTPAPGAEYGGRWNGQQYGFRSKDREAIFTVAGQGDLRCTEAPAD